MKNFLQYLTESQKTYEFRIKVANIDPADTMDRLEAALDAYGLESISKPKRLPLCDTVIDFPSMKNVELYLIDVVLKYPVNDAQLLAIISERWAVPASNIVVVPKNHPEEQWRNNEGELGKFKKGEAVLDKPYEADCPTAAKASKAYVEVGSFLKELSKTKIEIAGKESADGKTTNDLPQGTKSPVGSVATKLPSPSKGK
jgi:hypothetical protein